MSQSASGHHGPIPYFDRQFGTPGIKLLPGDYYATHQDMVLVTVLGSCVAACIRDPQAEVGGMNHFMLPEGGDATSPFSATARYGVYAMEVLINELLKLGARRANLEAKVFGGGQVMAGFTQTNVGERNAAFVKQFLAMERIPIVAEDLRDVYPRKVFFFQKTGRVMVRKLRDPQTVNRIEHDYGRRLQISPPAGDVELFN